MDERVGIDFGAAKGLAEQQSVSHNRPYRLRLGSLTHCYRKLTLF